MRVSRVFFSMMLASGLHIGVLWAQEVGSRVRVREDTTVVTGTLLRLDTDSISIRSDERIFIEGTLVNKEVTLPITAATRLDVSTGRRSKGGTGAAWGFGVGMAFTLLATASASNQDPNSWTYVSPGAVLATGTVVFGGGGALIGYAIGSSSKYDTWTEVPLELPPPGDPYEVTQGMIQLGLRINF